MADTSYVVAGSLIDPVNGDVISNPVVEIQGDRIVSVTSGGKVPPSPSPGTIYSFLTIQNGFLRQI